MKYLHLTGNDPWRNLATDEYLLKNINEDFFVVSVNDPCVVIGKHQVANEEANSKYVNDNNIPVIRRISGGGTVYHDHGNINFSVIKAGEPGRQINFKIYTKPVIGYLNSLKINATLGGKNEIRCEGLKISGNAEHIWRNRVLHHGTILFSSDIDSLNGAIAPGNATYESRSVKSNRTTVTNIRSLLGEKLHINDFLTGLANYLRVTGYTDSDYELSEEDSYFISSLVESKYKTWEWNVGWGPPYIARSKVQLNGLPYQAEFKVKDGVIEEFRLEGDNPHLKLGKAMVGKRHEISEISNVLSEFVGKESEKIVYSFF